MLKACFSWLGNDSSIFVLLSEHLQQQFDSVAASCLSTSPSLRMLEIYRVGMAVMVLSPTGSDVSCSTGHPGT